MQILLLLPFFFLSLFNTNVDGYDIGDTVTDFELLNIDGNMVSMADFPEAKGFVVVFTCNHCPYAVFYEDRLVDMQNTYSEMGYQVIAINPNDPEVKPEDSVDNMKIRAAEKGFNFPYLFDEGQRIYPQFGATKTPHVFLLDASHVVRYIGAIDDNPQDASAVKVNYVSNAIAALEAGTDPDPSSTKAIGCSIKKKK